MAILTFLILQENLTRRIAQSLLCFNELVDKKTYISLFRNLNYYFGLKKICTRGRKQILFIFNNF